METALGHVMEGSSIKVGVALVQGIYHEMTEITAAYHAILFFQSWNFQSVSSCKKKLLCKTPQQWGHFGKLGSVPLLPLLE